MAVSDIVPQDGAQGNVKLHPYLITLVRWCVSCLWSSANELLRRLLSTSMPRLPQITAAAAGKQPPRAAKPRAASSSHLHPEPRVECAVLHAPTTHELDVIFVHGLYGSLGNTWRQGEWRTKYKLDPTKVPLTNHSSEPCCCTHDRHDPNNTQEMYAYETNFNESNAHVTFKQLNGCFKKILPNENSLITEQFYSNTLLQVDNYETQAKFVSEMFKNGCDTNCDTFKCNGFDDRCEVSCKCKMNECECNSEVKGCEAGCGCTCDECYSHCWPRDWLKEDFPTARVISINYTSDPYLWRPLWVKGTKRLRLHERADQMMEQLLALGVGQRPIVWVGHSKGGLFIKQIYCEAYEAHLKLEKSVMKQQSILNNNSEDQSDREYIENNVNSSLDTKYNTYNDNETIHGNKSQRGESCSNLLNNFIQEHSNASCATNGRSKLRNIDEMNEIRNNNNSGNSSFNEDDANKQDLDTNYNMEQDDDETYGCTQNGDVIDKPARYSGYSEYIDISVRKDEQYRNVEDNDVTREEIEVLSLNNEENRRRVSARATLWASSAGFMFYSVPHRGSPLAHIKTPFTSRSIELMEIAKDCPLVLELQARWLAAVGGGMARPLVRGLVETGRTLMSVLWLRIVSEDSADAGVGVLHGVSVDHREICKPASRACPLYTELTHLIRAATARCSSEQTGGSATVYPDAAEH